MKAISLVKWSLDGYDDRYCMYRFRSQNRANSDEVLLVSAAKLLGIDAKFAYLNPTTDRAEAESFLEKATKLLNI